MKSGKSCIVRLQVDFCVSFDDFLSYLYPEIFCMIDFLCCKLLKFQNITDVKDISGLRRLFNTIDMQVQSLKNLGYESDSYGPLLIPIITSKIPNALSLIISRKFDSAENWDIKIVFDALKTEITAWEKTVLFLKEGEIVRDEHFEIMRLYYEIVLWKLNVSNAVNNIMLSFAILRKAVIVVIALVLQILPEDRVNDNTKILLQTAKVKGWITYLIGKNCVGDDFRRHWFFVGKKEFVTFYGRKINTGKKF